MPNIINTIVHHVAVFSVKIELEFDGNLKIRYDAILLQNTQSRSKRAIQLNS